MIERLRQLQEEYLSLQAQLQDPNVYGNPKEIARIGKRSAQLEPLIDLLKEYEAAEQAIAEAKSITDPDLKALAEEEAMTARERLPKLEEEMRSFLIPRDPNDDKSVILEEIGRAHV